jgi:hypothetical protein
MKWFFGDDDPRVVVTVTALWVMFTLYCVTL